MIRRIWGDMATKPQTNHPRGSHTWVIARIFYDTKTHLRHARLRAPAGVRHECVAAPPRATAEEAADLRLHPGLKREGVLQHVEQHRHDRRLCMRKAWQQARAWQRQQQPRAAVGEAAQRNGVPPRHARQ